MALLFQLSLKYTLACPLGKVAEPEHGVPSASRESGVGTHRVPAPPIMRPEMWYSTHLPPGHGLTVNRNMMTLNPSLIFEAFLNSPHAFAH